MNSFEKYSNIKYKAETEHYESVFKNYDKNGDGYLDESEFTELTDDLFSDITTKQTSAFFSICDLDQDGLISLEEFRYAWLYWIKQILKPVKALVVVDVQNDFISGSLSLSECPAGQDGAAIVPVINSLLEQDLFDVVVFSSDWHPENHISFVDNVKARNIHNTSKVTDVDNAKVLDTVTFEFDGHPREQTLWPRHCTQGSWGAKLHENLKVPQDSYRVNKGINPDVDSYSSFWDNDKLSKTELSDILRKHKVTDVYVCGLAYDICVGFTAHHSVDHGFRTIFIEDAARGVSLDGIANMRKDLVAKGVCMANSSEVPALSRSEVRPACLGAQAAFNYNLAWKIVKQKTGI